MKNHTHLANLNWLLGSISLNDVPVLVIDDEADQAGLNTLAKTKGEASPTYQHLLQLRQSLAKHTFLQYTATPQAPLLLNIIDILSPNLAETVSPGDDYIGAKEFFLNADSRIRVIPENEIFTNQHPLSEPPESLIFALRIFFVGVANELAMPKRQVGHPSMLIHPSQKTALHSEFSHWVRQIQSQWTELLADSDDPDYCHTVEQFREAYKDLESTAEYLMPFDKICMHIQRAVRSTVVTEINSKQFVKSSVNWSNDFSHILVGGQAMDRGFTVEGLTVTYMPRGKGRETSIRFSSAPDSLDISASTSVSAECSLMQTSVMHTDV